MEDKFVYDNTNRKKTYLVRFTDEEHEALRYESFKTKKPINQIIIEKLFKKEEK
jgi:hypothetical protein|uniref:NikA, BACTERIAL CONJUGATION, RELAXASE, DNA n=1 Tax=Siphoviridae sp. ctpoI7 TaxID=2825678 RepID=A0A8S5PAU9_9CAUD|nr:MAG TPA: NikA, BACTERIAL CONJUGATION, RELAXASE, DNA [Siphoviridae sp. ctpoI7]